jgi:hypothetical protein
MSATMVVARLGWLRYNRIGRERRRRTPAAA